MYTIQSLATEMAAQFQTKTRDNGESFECLKDSSPQWMTDSIRQCHAFESDTMLPNDHIYKWVRSACDYVADLSLERFPDVDSIRDQVGEFAAANVDSHNLDVLRWLASNLAWAGIVDGCLEARGGQDEGIVDAIARGQECAIEHVFYGLLSELDNRCEFLSFEEFGND